VESTHDELQISHVLSKAARRDYNPQACNHRRRLQNPPVDY
jgi:hypothetical protein